MTRQRSRPVGELDPELARAAALRPRVPVSDPFALRREFRRAVQISRTLRADVNTAGVEIEDRSVIVQRRRHVVPVRIYRPADDRVGLPVLVYAHGGAFVAGDLDTEHDRCLRLAAGGRCAVVSVDYRLPPEHPFPAPFDDCMTVLRWVRREGPHLGFDPTRSAVGGSSTGAALAACMAQAVADAGEPRLLLQLLLFPALDDRLHTGSMRGDPEAAEDSAHMWRHYLGNDPAVRSRPYAVPGRRGDLRGLAPAYVLVAGADPLRDEGIDYARRLLHAGVAAELHHFPGGFHTFDAAVPGAGLSQRALRDQTSALRYALQRTPCQITRAN